MYRVHGDARFDSLSRISVTHLYNLRQGAGYRRQRRHFEKTLHTCSRTAQRRKPDPQNNPGYLRLDTVHQGDLDAIVSVRLRRTAYRPDTTSVSHRDRGIMAPSPDRVPRF
jgi:hypothetical protein